MNPEPAENALSTTDDLSEIIVIHDPEIDVEALMDQVRANVARRRAEGAYAEDLDAIADEVRAQVLGSRAPAAPEVAEKARLQAELEARWLIREPDFSSNAPVVGPLIVAVRRAWNWMSTKWYVRGIVDQQVSFNALVVYALDEMHAANETLAVEVKALTARCTEQEEEIRRLQERLNDDGADDLQGGQAA